jgi:hypothetical protein
VAAYSCENPAFSVSLIGEMLKVTGFAVMETTADVEAEGSLTLVAVTVAVPALGTDAGAE